MDWTCLNVEIINGKNWKMTHGSDSQCKMCTKTHSPFHYGGVSVCDRVYSFVIVCKFSYNTRSAAVLWPNKFNTTYAIGQCKRTHSNLFTFIYFLDDVGRFLFTHGLKILYPNPIPCRLPDPQMNIIFDWKLWMEYERDALTYSIHLACNKCRYHSQFITFCIFRY